MKSWVMKVLLPLVLIVACFYVRIWLGIAAVLLFLAWSGWRNRCHLYFYRANQAYQQGNREKALEWLSKAAAAGNRPRHLLSWAYVLLRSGDREKAEEILSALPNRNLSRPDRMNAELYRALVDWKKGKPAEAAERMERVYEQFKTTLVYGTLGYLYIACGDLERALQFNQEARDFNDSDGVILDNLGQTHFERGEYDKAADVYESLMSRKPEFPEPYYHYGRVLHKLGRPGEAKEHLKKALEFDFHDLNTVTRDDVQKALDELESTDLAH